MWLVTGACLSPCSGLRYIALARCIRLLFGPELEMNKETSSLTLDQRYAKPCTVAILMLCAASTCIACLYVPLSIIEQEALYR